MIKRIFKTIDDFINWSREYKIPEFKITSDIIDSVDMDSMIQLSSTANIARDFFERMKLEKDLELRQNMLDEYQEIYDKYQIGYESFKSNLIITYNKKCGGDIFEDMERSIKWIPQSKYFSSIELNVITKLNDILLNSLMKKDMDNSPF